MVLSPTCTKPVLNAVFLDKNVDERCTLFFDSMKSRIANLESEQSSSKNSVKILENTVAQNNSTVNYYTETLDSFTLE